MRLGRPPVTTRCWKAVRHFIDIATCIDLTAKGLDAVVTGVRSPHPSPVKFPALYL